MLVRDAGASDGKGLLPNDFSCARGSLNRQFDVDRRHQLLSDAELYEIVLRSDYKILKPPGPASYVPIRVAPYLRRRHAYYCFTDASIQHSN